MAAVTGVLLIGRHPPLATPWTRPPPPGNEMLDDHPWGDRGCILPGAAIDSVPGLFDFRHACTHHDGCYQGFDRMGGATVIDRLRCDELFRTDLTASCEYLHGAAQNWRPASARAPRTPTTRWPAPSAGRTTPEPATPPDARIRVTVLPWQHPGTRFWPSCVTRSPPTAS